VAARRGNQGKEDIQSGNGPQVKTSRTQVARFIDPENFSIQLDTTQKAAARHS